MAKVTKGLVMRVAICVAVVVAIATIMNMRNGMAAEDKAAAAAAEAAAAVNNIGVPGLEPSLEFEELLPQTPTDAPALVRIDMPTDLPVKGEDKDDEKPYTEGYRDFLEDKKYASTTTSSQLL